MLSGWSIILISLAYVGVLFAIAYYGDSTAKGRSYAANPVIYSLSLAVYCSSWTFYGAVGRAASSGWEFLATYLGPVLVFIFGWRLIEKVILVSKEQNITTISDFVSSRYGKSQSLAILVTLIAVLGTIPYIALQLKAVAISYDALAPAASDALSKGHDTALFVALLMAVFAVLFGTRHIDATEHHEGMVLAVAFESIVKLAAFLSVGLFVTFQVFEGLDDMLFNLVSQLSYNENFGTLFKESFLTETLLACGAVLCLPRQFHVTIVENTNVNNLRTARWLFPLYLVLLAAFVLPISVAGYLMFGQGAVDADTFVLMLPLAADYKMLATFAFIGGLSASTSMVIVASVTLATMVCNDIVMPLLLRVPRLRLDQNKDLGALLLRVRRITIVCLLLLAYFYYRILGDQGSLASFGLLAFVAAIQFLPAILGGIYWKAGNRFGALAGLCGGFFVWVYTLVIPTLLDANLISHSMLPLQIRADSWLAPTNLFGLGGPDGLEPLSHGVFWSLAVNGFLYLLLSHYSGSRLVDRIQASAFVDVYSKELLDTGRHYGQVTVGDLQMLTERFLGSSRTQHAFAGFSLQRNEKPPLSGDRATPEMIQFTERLLAGVIGASSARIVLASILRGKEMQIGDVVTIVDEASQALRFNRSLLQSTIENITQGISVVDQQLRLVAWNRRYIEMFRYPDGLICVGRPIEEIFRYNAGHGEYGDGDVEELVQQRLESLQDSNPHVYERYRPNGTVVEVRGNPMPNGGFVTTYADITSHKRIEAALRESEQNIRTYTDNVPILIAYLDNKGRYLFVNKAYADAFGLDRHNVQGLSYTDVLSPDERAERAGLIDKALSGERVRFESRMPSRAPTAQPRYAEVTYIPHFNERGRVTGYFTLYQDITERRIAELALKETNETLEQRVRERTQALSTVNRELRKENTVRALIEDELRQAKADAEAANLGKTRFLAAASHDLLQPLNAARLFTSALDQQSHDESTHQLVRNLDGSLRAAEELITAILDISKLDAGALEPNITDFPISQMLTNLSTEFTLLAGEKQLQLRWRDSRQVVRTDQALLRRILQNFLSNAVRYTQHGKILLGARRRGDRLRLEVWDTGVGIAPDKLDEVFEEFRRIDNPKHSQVKGLGLGLAITDRIARMLGHRIQVRSWPGRGTVFSIEVPLGDPAKAVKPKAEQRGWIRSKGLNGLKVLVIDNEPKILEGMRALLGGWSCETLTALSVDEARVQLDASGMEPDIILADYHLNETYTGLMALQELTPRWAREIPAVIITADRTDGVRDEIADAGAQLLTKPVKPAALRAMINKLTASSGSGTIAANASSSL
ncbi:MAG: PAS-domain containing protein [Oceanospirillaceae bacterium]|nr:PAS-domain containing protein [Oceanospirillaceae bacterium]